MEARPSSVREEVRHFTPTPISEARAFVWDDLLEPTQKGLRELFSWLDAACRMGTKERNGTDEHLSTSLLISGARGSGKTTILLSADQALRDWRSFVGKRVDGRERRDEELHPDARELSGTLERIAGRIIWLRPLDLEPVPAGANLLATLLVRVRAALDESRHDSHSHGGSSRWSAASILEESAEEAWGRLDQLIRDASFMWEDIPVTTDARTRADQQIRASEIYANFRQRFAEAMEGVTTTLSMPRFGTSSGEQVVLVLPIDNVDRSIEHLYNIVKLTRMVASPRLWFVLAAGHQEFQLFMERSFQKELIISGQAGIGQSGQDETLAIARRQAATTLRRALPPSYRINLEPVRPHDAWNFSPQASGKGGSAQRLCELLERLALPGGTESDDTRELRSFADLFDQGRRLTPAVRKALQEARAAEGGNAEGEEAGRNHDDLLLTHAGRLALTLPTRTLQDLWHAVRRELESTPASEATRASGREEGAAGATAHGGGDPEKTVRVATEMLRNAIDESELPDWASDQLHNRILRLDDKGHTFLDLTGRPVCRSKRSTLSDVLEWPFARKEGNGDAPAGRDAGAVGSVLLTELHLRHFHEVVLVLNDLAETGRTVPLPASVAGWFMLLHDVLMLFEPARVLNVDMQPFELSPELVVTLHELWVGDARGEQRLKVECWWVPPTWNTFIEFATLTAQWKAFTWRTGGAFFRVDNMGRSQLEIGSHHRFIQAAWVENICSVAGRNVGGWDWGAASEGLRSVVEAKEYASAVEGYEQRVREAVAALIGDIRKYSRGYDRLWTARVWLQQTLPLLVLPEFAPDPSLSELLRWNPATARANAEHWTALETYWSAHAPRLKHIREDLMRRAVEESLEAQAFLDSRGGDRTAASRLRDEWRNTVVRTWFSLVDRERHRLEVGALREMSPLGSARTDASHAH